MAILQQKEINVIDYLNARLFEPNKPRKVWLSCYQAISVRARSKRQCVIRFGDLACILLSGKIKYYESAELPEFEQVSTGIKVHLPKMREKESYRGYWLIIAQPYQPSGGADSDLEWEPRQKEICAILSIVVSKNLVYRKVFDNVVNVNTNEIESFTKPYPMETPRHERLLDAKKIQESICIDERIREMSEPEMNRTKLGLMWFYDASEEAGTKAFLQYWIAMEVAFMEQTSDIRPIKDLLGRIYDKSPKEIGETFHIGRVYGLRNEIVHGGFSRPLSTDILGVMNCLFRDLLYYVVLSKKTTYTLDYINNNNLRMAELTKV